MSYTFLQELKNLSSFKFCSVLEENCGADINNGTLKCKTFVDNCCKKRPLSGSYFPTKGKFFQVSQRYKSLKSNCAIKSKKRPGL